MSSVRIINGLEVEGALVVGNVVNVTQDDNIGAAVTANGNCGVITMAGDIGTGVADTFVFNNNRIKSNSLVFLTPVIDDSESGDMDVSCAVKSVANGSCKIVVESRVGTTVAPFIQYLIVNNADSAGARAESINKLRVKNALELDGPLVVGNVVNVTQLTSIGTAVTAHGTCGVITLAGVVGATTADTFTFTNNRIKSNSLVFLTPIASADDADFTCSVKAVADGSCKIVVESRIGTTGAPGVQYLIINSA